jgi:hypothetical protein
VNVRWLGRVRHYLLVVNQLVHQVVFTAILFWNHLLNWLNFPVLQSALTGPGADTASFLGPSSIVKQPSRK